MRKEYRKKERKQGKKSEIGIKEVVKGTKKEKKEEVKKKERVRIRNERIYQMY